MKIGALARAQISIPTKSDGVDVYRYEWCELFHLAKLHCIFKHKVSYIKEHPI